MLPSVHWTIERVIAVGMIPLYPIALYIENPTTNFLVVTAVSMHAYWGLDGVIKDYAFERRYGPLLMPILRTIWKLICATGFAGLLYFNYNDIGFIAAVKKLWSV
ncbi:Succinate dehydrogenase [ubiquinone] cytochrome b small subunit [Fasciola gigantica]|nr:Succinate dehydrogenase [ubiquinone] cytochrome b small subunit [Fasciola gigantica]